MQSTETKTPNEHLTARLKDLKASEQALVNAQNQVVFIQGAIQQLRELGAIEEVPAVVTTEPRETSTP